MALSPLTQTLVADTDTVFTLDKNYQNVEVSQIENPARTYVNTKGSAVPTTGGTLASLAGNHAMPAVLCSLRVPDETSTDPTVVHVRSVGTPTISVRGY